jgi:hypothetical protein
MNGRQATRLWTKTRVRLWKKTRGRRWCEMFLEMVRDLKAKAQAVWPQQPTSRATRTCLTYPVTLHCQQC